MVTHFCDSFLCCHYYGYCNYVLEVAHIDHTPLILQHLTLNQNQILSFMMTLSLYQLSGQNMIAYLLSLLC